jgi:hypothetical protein
MGEKLFSMPHRVEYTNKQLKDLLLKAWMAEVAKKEEELGRPLTEEERREFKITREFIDRQHKAGILPTYGTFQDHFGSIIHLANLLELPANRNRPHEIYYAGNKSEYIKALVVYVREFKKQNGRNPTKTEIEQSIQDDKIQGVTTNILRHLDIFDSLGIEKRQGVYEHENTYSDEDLIIVVKRAFEEKCKREAKRLNTESLTTKERRKLRLRGVDYKFFRKEGVLGEAPSFDSLVRRLGKEFGPSWDEVLEKAGLLSK